MTIDETIKVCEENAEKIGGNPQLDYHASWYKQVAEWLTELKALRSTLELCKKCQYVSECPINYPWLKED